MTFLAEFHQFKTLAEFTAFLSQRYPNGIPRWANGQVSGATIHNTFVPSLAQWHGQPTMIGMMNAYIAKGWDRGPHLYLCVGAPDSADDGIWTMTQLEYEGIHAGPCNADHFGIECVGDYQATVPAQVLIDLLMQVIVILARLGGVGRPFDVDAHRDCMARTCPGDNMYARVAGIRQDVLAQLAAPSLADRTIRMGVNVPTTDLIAYLDAHTSLPWYEKDPIVSSYTAFGELTTIGNLMPFAQAIHETAAFTSIGWTLNRNPGGLSAGTWGPPFRQVSDGVLAQYAHLLAYSAKDSELDEKGQKIVQLDPRLAPLTNANLRGAALRWKDLNGRWTYPGVGYAQAIAAIAEVVRS